MGGSGSLLQFEEGYWHTVLACVHLLILLWHRRNTRAIVEISETFPFSLERSSAIFIAVTCPAVFFFSLCGSSQGQAFSAEIRKNKGEWGEERQSRREPSFGNSWR